MAKGPKRILIVEDETLTAMAMGSYLEETGYVVLDYAATGEEAVSKARTLGPDIILMDVRLAGDMDGIEAAKLINKEKSIPVIFMTGYTSRAFVERSSELHPIGYLVKPVDFDDIKSILQAIA